MIPIYYMQHPFFEQYKIQSEKEWPWSDRNEQTRIAFWTQTKRTFKLASFNLFILLPIMSYGKIMILSKLGFKGLSFETDDESWPSPLKTLMDSIILTLIHDFGFYATHRISHEYRFLYKYHKVHHEYKMNNALAAQHLHPVDFIFTIAGPALLALAMHKCHSMTQFQWSLWTLFSNLDDHVGYSFPWSPIRWFPCSTFTDEHEFHHLKNTGCFGSKIDIFNRLLGGHEHYHKWVARRKQD